MLFYLKSAAEEYFNRPQEVNPSVPVELQKEQSVDEGGSEQGSAGSGGGSDDEEPEKQQRHKENIQKR